MLARLASRPLRSASAVQGFKSFPQRTGANGAVLATLQPDASERKYFSVFHWCECTLTDMCVNLTDRLFLIDFIHLMNSEDRSQVDTKVKCVSLISHCVLFMLNQC